MANAHLNIYKNNPTAGNADGTAVSTGDNSSPITFTVDSSNNEVASDTLAIRCEPGFFTASTTSISIVSDTANHWALSLNGETWGTDITITSTVGESNRVFYIKADSTSSENPQNDSSAKLRVKFKIAAVS